MKKIILVLILLQNVVFCQDNKVDNLLMDPFLKFPIITAEDFGKYGNDTLKCEENLTIYNEFYKQKSYDSAIN